MYMPPMFGLMETLVPVFSLIVFGLVIFAFVRSIREWNSNNHSPRLTVPARIVAKRTNHSSGGVNHTSSTTHFVTFEVESGDRMELCLSGTEYGMLAEGDTGRLTFQGTRFLGFERNR